MQIGKAFGYITRDPQWFKKLFIGSVVTAIPFVEAVSDGYQIQTIKNLRLGHERPLPDWNDAGSFFSKGIALRLMIYAIYIPTLITTGISIILTIAWLFSKFGNNSDTTTDVAVIRWLSDYVFLPLIDAAVLVILPIVFLIVPALARRLADGDSPLSLLNPLPTLSLIFTNFGDYVLTRLAVFLLGTIVGLLALSFNVLPVIGSLAGWLLVAGVRFTGRLVWAYSLAQMERPGQRIDQGVRDSIRFGAHTANNWQ